MRHRIHRSASLAAAAWIAAVLSAPVAAWAAGREACYTARIEAPVVLPDGSVHRAGMLRICDLRYSPALGLHDISVDGRALGRFLSRRTAAAPEGAEPGAAVVFRRSEAGLVLLGHAASDGRTSRIFDFLAEGGTTEALAAGRVGDAGSTRIYIADASR